MNMRDLDLNLLLVFEAIYSSRNISRAAVDLDLSQPALSNALARLRKQLDDQLFVRSGNGVVPTTRADEIIGPVRDALTTLRQSIGSAADFDPKTSKRHFRLLVADPLELTTIPKLIQSIGSDSQITFELQPPQSMPVEESLVSGKTDLAVFLLHGKNAELNSKPLCPVDQVVIASRDHPRLRTSVTMPELIKESFVSLSLEPGKLANSEKLTFWQRLNVREVCYVHKVSSIVQLVAKTELIGIVPRIYANQAKNTHGLQIFEIPTKLSDQAFHMIWHKRADFDPGLRWLQDTVMSCFTADQSDRI